MDDSKKQQVIAEVENVENIKDFYTEWWSVADLYETAAKAIGVLSRIMDAATVSSDEKKWVRDMVEQHLMMIDLIKPFEKKEDDV